MQKQRSTMETQEIKDKVPAADFAGIIRMIRRVPGEYMVERRAPLFVDAAQARKAAYEMFRILR